jgi:tRNA 2-thiouridine synthesizing protein A
MADIITTMLRKPDHILDATGLQCPEPVMLLHNRIRDIAVGETLQIVATDPSTERDIPKFCAFLGHELLQQETIDEQYHYLIRKKVSQ